MADLNARFALDWRFTTKEDIPVIAAPFAGADVRGKLGVQIVSSGPESPKEEVKSAFLRMITYAEKNVYIQTPYFRAGWKYGGVLKDGGLVRRGCENYDTTDAGSYLCILGDVFLCGRSASFRRPCVHL